MRCSICSIFCLAEEPITTIEKKISSSSVPYFWWTMSLRRLSTKLYSQLFPLSGYRAEAACKTYSNTSSLYQNIWIIISGCIGLFCDYLRVLSCFTSVKITICSHGYLHYYEYFSTRTYHSFGYNLKNCKMEVKHLVLTASIRFS